MCKNKNTIEKDIEPTMVQAPTNKEIDLLFANEYFMSKLAMWLATWHRIEHGNVPTLKKK